MALHRIAQEQLPVVDGRRRPAADRGADGRSKSYAERLFDFPQLDPLHVADARTALVEPARSEGAAYTATRWSRSSGHPGISVLPPGMGLSILEHRPPRRRSRWRMSGREPRVTQAPRAGFFRVRFDRLTPRERDYVRAMAALGPGPHRSGDMAAISACVVTASARCAQRSSPRAWPTAQPTATPRSPCRCSTSSSLALCPTGHPETVDAHAPPHRHPIHPHHRRRPDRHRPGLRVRLFRRPGLQGAAGGGLPGHPGQLQPRHHHDRPGPGGRDLYRADHARTWWRRSSSGRSRTPSCPPWAGRPR